MNLIVDLILNYLQFCEECQKNIEPDTFSCEYCQKNICKYCLPSLKCNQCENIYCEDCTDFKKIENEYYCEDCYSQCFICNKFVFEINVCEYCCGQCCDECINCCERYGSFYCKDCL